MLEARVLLATSAPRQGAYTRIGRSVDPEITQTDIFIHVAGQRIRLAGVITTERVREWKLQGASGVLCTLWAEIPEMQNA